MPVGDDPHLVSLFATGQGSRDPDHRLAALYAPTLNFDAREPFLPKAMAYTIFRESADSPSFPRRVELRPGGHPPATLAIEYAIWWDWDITHLYDLEHVWVFLGPGGRVVGVEASWHGDHRIMAVDGSVPLTDGRLSLYSEPGKHALAPSFDFSLSFSVDDEALVPWPVLDRWIPKRVAWLADELEGAQAAPKGPGPPDAPETSDQRAKVVGR